MIIQTYIILLLIIVLSILTSQHNDKILEGGRRRRRRGGIGRFFRRAGRGISRGISNVGNTISRGFNRHITRNLPRQMVDCSDKEERLERARNRRDREKKALDKEIDEVMPSFSENEDIPYTTSVTAEANAQESGSKLVMSEKIGTNIIDENTYRNKRISETIETQEYKRANIINNHDELPAPYI